MTRASGSSACRRSTARAVNDGLLPLPPIKFLPCTVFDVAATGYQGPYQALLCSMG